jgi:hypothetical protein
MTERRIAARIDDDLSAMVDELTAGGDVNPSDVLRSAIRVYHAVSRRAWAVRDGDDPRPAVIGFEVDPSDSPQQLTPILLRRGARA